ncbi:hypothetical protein [Halobacillus litoralis]|uniref:hypothetical protein n=1 Tax=Halobacillus litoralis TaxID=45668 RepID=UPI002492ADA9|nr:hypothetical protein [Halobacillus litoralis]
MKSKQTPKSFLLILLLVLLASVALFIFYITRPSHQAESVVEEFYIYEQKAQFSDSWELLHSQMKDKFTKGHYIQDRAHVFMNHFGVETFSFTINDVKKMDEWSMEKGSKPLKGVYYMTVVQTFKGKYGHFRLHQDVYVAKEKEEWKILWDYHK